MANIRLGLPELELYLRKADSVKSIVNASEKMVKGKSVPHNHNDAQNYHLRSLPRLP